METSVQGRYFLFKKKRKNKLVLGHTQKLPNKKCEKREKGVSLIFVIKNY